MVVGFLPSVSYRYTTETRLILLHSHTVAHWRHESLRTSNLKKLFRNV